MIIILFGAPGVGKGTQAKLLQERKSFRHLSTGDLLRSAIKNNTDLGRLAKSFMDKGELVTDDVVIGLVREVISHSPNESFILDGFPRTHAQAVALDVMLAEIGTGISNVINLMVPDEEIIHRLSQRRVCVTCGATYNLLANAPKKEGICDACGSEVVQRDDDSVETIRKRLALYLDKTAPLLNYYRITGKLAELDAVGDIEAINSELVQLLVKVG
ncbi:MAG: adenylate kinase [Bacteroidetes bacterium]|nr:adenylate kinase [Bacteroidota bacterium]